PLPSSPRMRGPIFRNLPIRQSLWIPAFEGMTKHWARLTQSLPFNKTFRPVTTGDRVGFHGRHQFHFWSDRQAAVLARLAFFAEVARRCAAGCDAVLHMAARQARPPRAGENDPARAVSATNSAQPLERSRHRLSDLQCLRLWRDVFLGAAVLPVHLERHHRGPDRTVRTGVTLDVTRLCDALGRHRDAV